MTPLPAPNAADYLEAGRRLTHQAAALLVWITVAISGVVFFEPAPYEFLVLGCLGLYLLLGMRIAPQLAPLLLLFVIFLAASFIGAIQARPMGDSIFYTIVSGFLTATCFFFAIFVAEDPEPRMRYIASAYLVAGCIAALAGIVGYFGVAYDTFTLFGRARGTFQDPNVFGPFLIFPAMLALYTLLSDRPARAVIAAGILGVLSLALLLSFSRGAWLHLVLSATVVIYLKLALSSGFVGRLRTLVLVGLGIIALSVGIMAALSIDSIADLMRDRFSLVQSYDSGPEGRFGRHIAGFALALEKPLGIGALQFGRLYFTEDPHNVYLNVLMTSGWVGAFAYYVIVGWTLLRGFKAALVASPLQPYLICALATLIGLALEGAIIDTDRWRHFYLLIGVIWGMTARPIVAQPDRHWRAPQAAPAQGVAR